MANAKTPAKKKAPKKPRAQKKAPKKPAEPKPPSREQKRAKLDAFIADATNRATKGGLYGDKSWLKRLVGRPREFEDPEDLVFACVEYLLWCENNPLQEEKVFNSSGSIRRTHIKKARAPLVKQMCTHIGISYPGWKKYTKREDELGTVARAINQIIHDTKLQGAYSGLFDSVIAHRDLNMVDRHDFSSGDGTMSPKESDPLDLSKLSMKELKALGSLAKKLGSGSQKPQSDPVRDSQTPVS